MKKLLLAFCIAVSAPSIISAEPTKFDPVALGRNTIVSVKSTFSFLQNFSDTICIIGAGLIAETLLHHPSCRTATTAAICLQGFAHRAPLMYWASGFSIATRIISHICSYEFAGINAKSEQPTEK